MPTGAAMAAGPNDAAGNPKNSGGGKGGAVGGPQNNPKNSGGVTGATKSVSEAKAAAAALNGGNSNSSSGIGIDFTRELIRAAAGVLSAIGDVADTTNTGINNPNQGGGNGQTSSAYLAGQAAADDQKKKAEKVKPQTAPAAPPQFQGIGVPSALGGLANSLF